MFEKIMYDVFFTKVPIECILFLEHSISWLVSLF